MVLYCQYNRPMSQNKTERGPTHVRNKASVNDYSIMLETKLE